MDETVDTQAVDGGEGASVAPPADSLQRERAGEKTCFHVKFLSLQDRPHITLQVRNPESAASPESHLCAFITYNHSPMDGYLGYDFFSFYNS